MLLVSDIGLCDAFPIIFSNVFPSKFCLHAIWQVFIFESAYDLHSLFCNLAWMVQPRNYLLFACHFTNATAQTVQDIRFVKYWHYGGREKKYGITRESLESGTKEAKVGVTKAVEAAREEAKKVAGK